MMRRLALEVRTKDSLTTFSPDQRIGHSADLEADEELRIAVAKAVRISHQMGMHQQKNDVGKTSRVTQRRRAEVNRALLSVHSVGRSASQQCRQRDSPPPSPLPCLSSPKAQRPCAPPPPTVSTARRLLGANIRGSGPSMLTSSKELVELRHERMLRYFESQVSTSGPF